MSWTARIRSTRETRDTCLLLLVMAWVAAPLYSVVPLWCSSLSALVMVWRGWLAWRERAMPPGWVRLVLLVLSLGLTAMSFKTILGPDAGVTLIVALLAIKTLELRARRDALVVFFLCFFLMLTHFFYGQSLLNALGMLVGVLGLLTALINAHSPVEPAPLLTSAKLALRMTLLGLPLMVALYVLFPRVAPLWGLPSQAPVANSGLSADMTVGSVAQLALDRSVALRLRFEGPDPPAARLYFRGPVLSDFDGRQWQARRTTASDWVHQVITQGPALHYELTLQAHHQNWLLSLDATVQAPELADGQARAGRELQWLRPRGVHTPLRYRAQAFEQAHWEQALSPAQRAANTALPAASNPQTRAWATELLAQAPREMQDRRHSDYNAYWAQRALAMLRAGDYRYTLTPGVYGDDTADVFWFSRRAGFCEHIASAYAVLMRALNIPARIVTGYQGGERNPVDGMWTVRQSDAHAWVEVWLPGLGWQRVDPTAAIAPQRIEQGSPLAINDALLPSSGWSGLSVRWAWRARWAWEALNNRWNQWVLGYEQPEQLALLRWLGFTAPEWQDLLGLLAGLAALVSTVGLAWLKWRRPQQDAWLHALSQARRRLRQAGLDCPDQTSPGELAQAVRKLGTAQPGQAACCQAWVDCLVQLERWRYDRPKGAAHRQAALATLQRQCQTLALPQFPKPAPTAPSNAHPAC